MYNCLIRKLMNENHKQKNATGATLRLSSNVIGNANDTNFPPSFYY